MFFTQEDYKKIEDWLYKRTVRDTEFPIAEKLDGTESIPIIQKGKNKNVGLNDFVRRVAEMKLPDFYNVTANHNKVYLELKDAISLVPVEQRKLGLTITYHNEHGNWLIYQFVGDSLNQWSSIKCWTSIIQQAIEEWIFHPDEEDITAVRIKDKQYLKFKDRYCNNYEFIGKGKIILRRNPVGTQACSIDDEDHVINLLTQEMINEPNTVYIVQYDFDLNGKVLSIPEGSTLWFQGGTINNGTLYLQETSILGAYEFSDMGNINLFGSFKKGQIMTFLNRDYKWMKDHYFIESTRPGSNGDEDEEVVYIKNPDAFETAERQELRWWDGSDWILILDLIDYVHITSIIEDLIDKHNAEMSECYKYFKQELQAVNNRIDQTVEDITNINNTITNIEGDINNINNAINNITGDITNIVNDIENKITNLESIINNIGGDITNIDQTIENTVKKYISELTAGCTAIEVNGNRFEPDASGTIKLPDYPSGGGSGGDGGIADSVKGTLTVKTADNKVLGTYNGSEDKTITIPTIPSSGEGGSGTPVVLSNLILKNQKGDTKVTYNGDEEKVVKGGSLTIKTDYPDKVFESFDDSNVTLDLTPAICGDTFHSVVLFAGYFYRNRTSSRDWYFSGMTHNLINSLSCRLNDSALDVSISSNHTVSVLGVYANVRTSQEYLTSNKNSLERGDSPMSMWTRMNNDTISFVCWRNTDKGATRANALAQDNKCLSFYAVAIGHITKRQ